MGRRYASRRKGYIVSRVVCVFGVVVAFAVFVVVADCFVFLVQDLLEDLWVRSVCVLSCVRLLNILPVS